jgi:hypothetical protein
MKTSMPRSSRVSDALVVSVVEKNKYRKSFVYPEAWPARVFRSSSVTSLYICASVITLFPLLSQSAEIEKNAS